MGRTLGRILGECGWRFPNVEHERDAGVVGYKGTKALLEKGGNDVWILRRGVIIRAGA